MPLNETDPYGVVGEKVEDAKRMLQDKGIHIDSIVENDITKPRSKNDMIWGLHPGEISEKIRVILDINGVNREVIRCGIETPNKG